MARDLSTVLESLYSAEINFQITTFWDAGVLVQLGDDMNGFKAEQTFYPDNRDEPPGMSEIADWLHDQACALYPIYAAEQS